MRSGIGNTASDPFYVTQTSPSGISAPSGTVADPTYERSVGSTNFATAQAATSISPAAATSLVAARAIRRSVTITNITGTQPVYLLTTAAITGVTTGHFIPGTAGASITIPTTAAIFGTSPTAAQTVSVLETY